MNMLLSSTLRSVLKKKLVLIHQVLVGGEGLPFVLALVAVMRRVVNVLMRARRMDVATQRQREELSKSIRGHILVNVLMRAWRLDVAIGGNKLEISSVIHRHILVNVHLGARRKGVNLQERRGMISNNICRCTLVNGNFRAWWLDVAFGVNNVEISLIIW